MSKEVKPVVERWEDKLSRLHPTIQKGKWPKSWREEAIAQELLELRADYDALLAERDRLREALEQYALPVGDDIPDARAEFGDAAVDRELARRAAIAAAKGGSE